MGGQWIDSWPVLLHSTKSSTNAALSSSPRAGAWAAAQNPQGLGFRANPWNLGQQHRPSGCRVQGLELNPNPKPWNMEAVPVDGVAGGPGSLCRLPDEHQAVRT